MQIPSLFSAVPTMVNSGLRMLGVEVSGGIAKPDGDADAAAPSVSAASLLDDVDLSAITPDDFSALIDRLRESGELPNEGYEELLGVRLELDRARVPHDQPIDVLGLIQAKLDGLQRLGQQSANPAADQTKRQMEWLEKVSGKQGINALA